MKSNNLMSSPNRSKFKGKLNRDYENHHLLKELESNV